MIKTPQIKIDLNKIVRAAEYFKKAESHAKGFIGEFVIDKVAKRYLNEDYKIISDVVLKYGDGTTQIDQIIVSPYGIIVVEIKNYKGWIFGSNGMWTQSLYREKHTFQSPLKQNCKHINALQSLLKLPDDMFRSLIVFSDEAIFKTTMPNNVVRGAGGYLNYIKNHKTVLFDEHAVAETVKMIESHRLSKAEHQAYMNRLKAKYDTGDINKPPTCPKCQKEMVLRTTKRGRYKGRKFWGCEGYPKCRVTMEIKNDKIRNIEKAFNMIFN